jgi:hypothetical protein
MTMLTPIILAALLLAPAAGGQGGPDLSGGWTLKDTPTPDSVTVSDSAAPASRSDMRPVVRPGSRPEAQAQLRRLVGMAQPIAAFTITQSDTAITFTNVDGFTYTVHPGRDRDSIATGDAIIPTRARWRGSALEVEFRPPGGGRITETYTLADSGVFLRVEVVVEHESLAQRLWRPRMYRRQTAN